MMSEGTITVNHSDDEVFNQLPKWIKILKDLKKEAENNIS
jgi:hypothetical protein